MSGPVSYRQVGGTLPGHLIHETHASRFGNDEVGVPSIPSKYQRRRRAGPGEGEAFGSSTGRFRSTPNHLPGPGAYYKRFTLERDQSTCGSVSLKGYGSGFVSRSNRFRAVKELQDALLPGPGTYLGNDSSVTKHQSGHQSVFSKPRRYRGDPDVLREVLPGPGQYNTPSCSNQQRTRAPSSSFAPGPQRSGCSTAPDTPAPGQYDLQAQQQPQQKDKAGRPLMHASFRSKSARSAAFSPLPGVVPGPGEYDIHNSTLATKKDLSLSNKSSSVFSNTGLDRFGQPRQRKTRPPESPGPGWYTPDNAGAELPRGPASVFVSTSKRLGENPTTHSAHPGPAFYKPETLGRKSFHLNVARKWV